MVVTQVYTWRIDSDDKEEASKRCPLFSLRSTVSSTWLTRSACHATHIHTATHKLFRTHAHHGYDYAIFYSMEKPDDGSMGTVRTG